MNSSCLRGHEQISMPPPPRHSHRSMMSVAFGLTLSFIMSIANVRPAAAQAGTGDAQPAATAANGAPSAPDLFSDTWKFTLGGGIIDAARYPGSRDDFLRGVPLLGISYGRYFIGAVPGSGAPAGAGAYLLHTEHWAIGLDVGGDVRTPRRATDDPVLRGWGDIPSTAHGGMFASYTKDWLSVRGTISDALAHHEGVVASFAVEAKYHATQRLTLSIGPELTWVNNQYASTFFGIDAAQSEIAGIAPYRARGGINTVDGSAGATYLLMDHWSVGAHVSYGKLQGDAADSPVTTDKTQRTYSAFIAFRF
jgi:outer membrane protein